MKRGHGRPEPAKGGQVQAGGPGQPQGQAGAASGGQGRPGAAKNGQRRPGEARGGQGRPGTARSGLRRPRKARDGQERPGPAAARGGKGRQNAARGGRGQKLKLPENYKTPQPMPTRRKRETVIENVTYGFEGASKRKPTVRPQSIKKVAKVWYCMRIQLVHLFPNIQMPCKTNWPKKPKV